MPNNGAVWGCRRPSARRQPSFCASFSRPYEPSGCFVAVAQNKPLNCDCGDNVLPANKRLQLTIQTRPKLSRRCPCLPGHLSACVVGLWGVETRFSLPISPPGHGSAHRRRLQRQRLWPQWVPPQLVFSPPPPRTSTCLALRLARIEPCLLASQVSLLKRPSGPRWCPEPTASAPPAHPRSPTQVPWAFPTLALFRNETLSLWCLFARFYCGRRKKRMRVTWVYLTPAGTTTRHNKPQCSERGFLAFPAFPFWSYLKHIDHSSFVPRLMMVNSNTLRVHLCLCYR